MMPVSKKLKIAKQLFGESREQIGHVHQKSDESVKQTNPKPRVRTMDDAIHQERGAIRKQRRVIKIQRQAIEELTMARNESSSGRSFLPMKAP